MIYVCYDNEIYGNTGGQRSSATQAGARTSTTRAGKREPKKDIMAIMAAHRVPYAATLSLAHRDDFLRKLKTARRLSGFRFLLLLSPCPAGWKSDPAQGVDLVRKAVASGLFPLYEVFDGRSYRVNAHPDGTPLEDYLSGQGRFRSKALDVGALRAGVAEQWSFLDQMETSFPAADVDVHGPGGPDIAGDDAACAARWVMSVAVEDQPGVLSRVVGQFSRRSVNIGSLVVRAADDAGLSVITIAFDAGDQTAERLLGSVDKLVDVVWVTLPGVASARGRGRRPAARRGETCRRAR
jgi:acetolactate synthase regulatory subunit